MVCPTTVTFIIVRLVHHLTEKKILFYKFTQKKTKFFLFTLKYNCTQLREYDEQQFDCEQLIEMLSALSSFFIQS